MMAAGYIVQDIGGYAIAAIGITPEEARLNALDCVGPWEDRNGETVGPDHPEYGFDAQFKVLPAAAALIDHVTNHGGTVCWSVLDGIACLPQEEDHQWPACRSEPECRLTYPGPGVPIKPTRRQMW